MTEQIERLNSFPLWTAIITPFKEDGSLDTESFKALLKTQADAGNGVLLLGSTGESLALTLEEKKTVIRTALEEKHNIPYMVGVGGISLPNQLDWVNYLNTQNIDCYLVVTPLYAKPGQVGQFQWFTSLLDQAQKPCMLYNVPSRTGISMNFDTVEQLSGHSQFWAIKEASGSVEDFKKYKAAAPQARLYSGDDGLTPEFCQEGGVGLVSVASNVWPKETNKYLQLCLEGKYDQVKNWPRWADSLFIASNPVPAKAILQEKGVIASETLRLPLSAKDLHSRGPLVETDQEVNNWYDQIQS